MTEQRISNEAIEYAAGQLVLMAKLIREYPTLKIDVRSNVHVREVTTNEPYVKREPAGVDTFSVVIKFDPDVLPAIPPVAESLPDDWSEKSAREWAAWFTGLSEQDRTEIAGVVLFNSSAKTRCVSEQHDRELRQLRYAALGMIDVPRQLFEVQSPDSWLSWFSGLADEDRTNAVRAIMASSLQAHECRVQHRHHNEVMEFISKIRTIVAGLDN